MILLANIGVPMIFFQWAWMALALIPVIIVEAVVARRYVDLSRFAIWGSVSVANLYSTLIGIPVAWLLMFGIQMASSYITFVVFDADIDIDTPFGFIYAILFTSAWLEDALPGHIYLSVVIPIAVLMIPSFVVSAILEYRVHVRFWAAAGKQTVWRTTWICNAYSYGLLVLLALIIALCLILWGFL